MIDSMTSEDYPSNDISELKRIEEKQRNIELEIEKEKKKLLKSLKNKYAEELTNLSNKREEVIGRIQCFWAEALANHEIIGDLVSDEDIEIFEYMKTMTVIEPSEDDPRQATTIVFVFKDNNPYFHNTRLEKVFFTNPKGEQSIEFKPIRWKGELRDKQDIERVDSFFDWYQDADFPDEIGQIIIEDLFKYPSQHYAADDDDDDEDEPDAFLETVEE